METEPIRSPFLNFVTSLPVAITSPTTSIPGTNGTGGLD